MSCTGLEFGTLFDTTVTIETNVPGALHALLVKILYVTVPPELNPPEIVAESVAVVPTTKEGKERLVPTVGLAF